MNYSISTQSDTGKKFTLNEQEELFFNALYDYLSPDENSNIFLERMGNGCISVFYATYPVGKIKLQGRKHWMQILKGLYTSKTIEGDVENFITHVSDWEKYIKLHCKN